MAKRIIELTVSDEYVVGGGVPVGAAGSHDDVVLRMSFGEMWTGLNIYATFTDALGEKPTVVLLMPSMLVSGRDATYDVTIPAAAKKAAGQMSLSLTGFAVTGGTEDQATNTACCNFRVLPSKIALADDGTVDATLAEQLHSEMNAVSAKAEEAELTAADAVAAAIDASDTADSAKKVAAAAAAESADAIAIAGAAKNESALAVSAAKSADNVVRDLENRMNSGEFKGEKGDPFTVSKVYTSVAEMEADFANEDVAEGAFVAIETGNVDDEENARLYIKGADKFSFVTDLSGAQGIQGPQGIKGDPGSLGIHIGEDEPAEGQPIWIDTDEEEASFDVVAKAGQVLAVKSVDADGKPKEFMAVDLPKTKTADFAANEGEDGYIKNRTHYVDENGIVHKIPNKFIDADWMATKREAEGGIVFNASINFSNGIAFLSDYGGGFKVDPGIDYDVYWNGKLYQCTSKMHNDEPYIGNGSLALGAEDTGEPFCLYGVFLSPDLIYYVKKNTADAEAVDLRVTYRSEVYYNKLPKEYLPEGVVMSVNGKSPDASGNVETEGCVDVTASVGQTIVVEEVDANGKPTKWKSAEYQPRTHWDKTDYIIPDTTVNFENGDTGEFLVDNLLVEGETYVVTWNGIDYTCVCIAVTQDDGTFQAIGNPIIVGGEDTGLPFGFATAFINGNKVGLVFAVDDTVSSFSFSVKGKVSVSIPQKYLTNAFPYYIEATAELANSNMDCVPSNYAFQSSATEAAQAFASGREIKMRLTLQGGNGAHIPAIYTLLGTMQSAGNAIYIFSFPHESSNLNLLGIFGNIEKVLMIVGISADGTFELYTGE